MSNPIQPYAWGSRSVLARLQDRDSPADHPEAELWVGAHPSAPSTIHVAGRTQSLVDVIPDLPFLLKILAIDAPLSLQVHPSTEQAREGFAREDGAGIAPDAPERNYKDDRAKPETVVALSDMWVLSGERPAAELRDLGDDLGLEWLERAADQESAVRAVLALPGDRARDLVEKSVAATSRVRPAGEGSTSRDKDLRQPAPDDTALERAASLVELLDHHYPGDPGILVALCMNLVHLRAGQAMHTPAQQLHAYVSGTAVEIMGCSDNVLRAGLTGKHMDVAELLSVMAVRQSPAEPLDLHVEADGSVDYPLWDAGLSLTAVPLRHAQPVVRAISGPAVILVTEGRAVVRSLQQDAPVHDVAAGHSLLYLGEPVTVEFQGEGRAFVAGVASHP